MMTGSAILGMAVMMAGLIILLNMDSLVSLYLYALVYGFGYGCLAPMMPIMIADRFGLRDLGPVYGMLTFFIGIGGSVGPCFAGLIYDLYGSYDLVWQSSIGILVFVGLEITAQSFRATPERHFPAVALAILPALAYLAL